MVDNDDGDEDNDDDKDIDSDMVEVTHEDNETAKDELSVSQLEFFYLLDNMRIYLTYRSMEIKISNVRKKLFDFSSFYKVT